MHSQACAGRWFAVHDTVGAMIAAQYNEKDILEKKQTFYAVFLFLCVLQKTMI